MNTDDVSSWNFNVLWWLLWCSFLCVWQSTSCLSLHLSREGLLSCTQAYTIWWWKYKRGSIWIHCLELYCLFLECIQIQRCNVWPSSLTEYWFGLDLGCILYYLHLTSLDVSITFFVISGRCENGNPCDQNCYNIHNEMYECDCNQGYILSGNGYSCIGKYSGVPFYWHLPPHICQIPDIYLIFNETLLESKIVPENKESFIPFFAFFFWYKKSISCGRTTWNKSLKVIPQKREKQKFFRRRSRSLTCKSIGCTTITSFSRKNK